MDIKDIRTQIDSIDHQLVELFKQRMDVALKVANYKKENSLPILDATRERAVMCKVAEQAGTDLEQYAKVLYTALFDVSRSHQRAAMQGDSELVRAIKAAIANAPEAFPTRATVACQGIEGAYSQQACDRMFQFPSILYFSTFDAVFSAVEKGMCEYGVLPIENSAAGSVTQVYDLMERHNFSIVKGIRQRIDHVLLGKEGAQLSDIKQIVSHPQGIAQCNRFLAAHPEIEIVPMENTAVSAKYVADANSKEVAAIASRRCAALYNLTPVVESISDTDNNFTRFIVIGKKLQLFPHANKISMMLTLPHEPGALNRMISRFSAMGLNLTKLESRPIPGREFEFRFYFDVEANLRDPGVMALLDEIRHSSEHFVLLGNYQEGY